MQLLPHQIKALEETKNFNRVAVKGYEGIYEIDKQGSVFSILQNSSRRKRKLSDYPNEAGYRKVNLYDLNGKCSKKYIHRLVAEAFIPNPEELPEVNHIDADKTNNNVGNLERCDRKRNLEHAWSMGHKCKGENHGCHKLTEQEVIQIRKEYVKNDRKHSLHALAEKYNVNYCTIQAIIKRRLWKGVI